MSPRHHGRRSSLIALLRGVIAAAFVVCTPSAPGLRAQPILISSSITPVLAAPANVGDAKAAATAYHESGAYGRDLASIASDAGAWILRRAPQVSHPALVLDIDDTALTNWEVIKADDFGRIIKGRCAEAGGLMSYGPNLEESWRRIAGFVDTMRA